jgi:hypothetical protein
VRTPGRRRGNSRARAAFSRKRAANSAVEPSWRVTLSWMEAADGSSRAVSGGRSLSGRRMTKPSSAHIDSGSMPSSSRKAAATAMHQGAWTPRP